MNTWMAAAIAPEKHTGTNPFMCGVIGAVVGELHSVKFGDLLAKASTRDHLDDLF